MPSPKAVLRDIANYNLDPKLAHRRTDRRGRLVTDSSKTIKTIDETDSSPNADSVLVKEPEPTKLALRQLSKVDVNQENTKVEASPEKLAPMPKQEKLKKDKSVKLNVKSVDSVDENSNS